MGLMNTQETFAICQEALKPENQESVIRTWAAGMLFGNSHENPIVVAYLNLSDIGPKNDWNGERGAAMRLKQEMEHALVFKAATLKTKMQDAAIKVMTDFRLRSEVWEITDCNGDKRQVTVADEFELRAKHLASDDLNHTRVS